MAITNAQIIFEASQELLKQGKIKPTGRTFKAETENGEIEFQEAEPIHTFNFWKEHGFIVRKGEHAVAAFNIWKYTSKAKGKTEEELTKMIFALDETQVRNADIVFMNIDGRVPDEGAAVELGIAYGIGKRCYGVKTDTRAVEFGLEINPMISGCMLKLFKNCDGDKVIEEIKQYLSKNAL